MNKDNDKEAIRSEEERVASFMQALQRMHESPAEAARIDSVIEDAEIVAQQAPDRNQPQHVVVNVNGGEHNTVEISGAQHDATSGSHPAPEPVSPQMPDPVSERSRPVPTVQIARTRALATTASLVLLTTIALFAMQAGSTLLMIVVNIVAAVTAGLHVLLTSDTKRPVRRLMMPLRETPQELERH
ncbi:hypothetical protein AB0N81_36995 [Streptomyces sp. NPDC093510]|uniref:hypothetical protein n=1 Tax=Streptomyces sp. NPDC093510 TaxID=3155199 RepID=UPI00343F18FF